MGSAFTSIPVFYFNRVYMDCFNTRVNKHTTNKRLTIGKEKTMDEYVDSVIKPTNNSNNKRLKNICIKKPIIIGNNSVRLTEEEKLNNPKIPREHTHKWQIFIMSPTPKGDSDLSFIKKITFKLHDSYQPAVRTVEYQSFINSPSQDVPGFMVEETGWGEFEVGIKIYFQDGSQEKFLQLYHPLRLHSYYLILNNETGEYDQKPCVQKEGENLSIDNDNNGMVKSFYYDEIVFNEPYADFFTKWLMKSNSIMFTNSSDALKSSGNNVLYQHPFSEEMELDELERLENGLSKAEEMLNDLRRQYMEKQKAL